MLKSINTLQIERTMIRMEMKTEILPASDEKSIEKAAALLQNGELVALPPRRFTALLPMPATARL